MFQENKICWIMHCCNANLYSQLHLMIVICYIVLLHFTCLQIRIIFFRWNCPLIQYNRECCTVSCMEKVWITCMMAKTIRWLFSWLSLYLRRMSMASRRSWANMSLKRVIRFCCLTRCVTSSMEMGESERGRGEGERGRYGLTSTLKLWKNAHISVLFSFTV